ncbi:MAG: hypothetical protein JWR35_3931 [Marmoricola sp.]|nr:hypothetical protein [Marmoricola sp.]
MWSLMPAAVLLILATLPIMNLSSPVALGTLAWAVLWLANGLLGFDFYQSRPVLLLVFTANLAFYFGGLVVSVRHRPREDSLTTGERRDLLLVGAASRNIFALVLFVLGVMTLQVGLQQMGRSQGLLALVTGGQQEFFESLRLGKASLSQGNEWTVPSGVKLCTAALCAMAVLVGINLAARPEGQRPTKATIWMAALTAALAFVLSAGTGVRGLILVVAFLFVSSVLAAEVFISGGRNVISLKWLRWSVGSIAVFLVWVVVVQSARLQDTQLQHVGATLDHLRPWFAGYIPALGAWYDTSYTDTTLGWGSSLGRAVFSPLGLQSGEGFNERVDFVFIADGVSSNAMTIFRVIWSDFGVAGGMLVAFAAGAASEGIFRATVARGRGWLVALACVYASVLYSINYWFFGYGARVMGVAIAVAIVSATIPRMPARTLNKHAFSRSKVAS